LHNIAQTHTSRVAIDENLAAIAGRSLYAISEISSLESVHNKEANMDRRYEDILAMLNGGAVVSGDYIARHLGVSVRTVRNYVRRINEQLGNRVQIVSVPGQGYRLDTRSKVSYAELSAIPFDVGSRIDSPEDRVCHLMYLLAESSSWIVLDELSRLLFVSKSTIEQDLGRVEKRLADYGLKVERRPRHGIRVVGSEINRRRCLINLSLRCMGDKAALPDDCDVGQRQAISSLVVESICNAGIRMSPVGIQRFSLEIGIVADRISQGYSIDREDMPPAASMKLENDAAHEIAARIAENYRIVFAEEEVAFIAIYLASNEDPNASNMPSRPITDEVWALTDRMIEAVRSDCRFDLTEDANLRMNLAYHLMPLLVRLDQHIVITNPLLSDIKRQFPLAYFLAADACGAIQHGSAPIPDDEVGYLALSFELALERLNAKRPRQNVLLVTDTEAAVKRVLVSRIRQEFGGHAGEIRTCGISELKVCNLEGIDYVLTTEELPGELPVPVCYFNPFAERSGVHDIQEALSGGNARIARLQQCFCKELYFPHRHFADESEAIDFLSSQIEEHEGLGHDFGQLVREREKLGRTSFGSKVAFPHPTKPVGEHTRVAVTLLDSPIDWEGVEVQAIFMISPSSDDDTQVRELNEALAWVFMNPSEINQILADQTYETLVTHIEGADIRMREGGEQ
jgi:lichenan operon transcriptional antiterminator